MIIGTIKQQHDRLFTDVNSVANQYSDCLQLLVDFTDNYFDGYTLTWLYSSDRDMQKTSKLNYNVANKLITLPYDALKKDGSIFISVKAYWHGVTITSRPVCFYISKTLNTDATDIPREPGWEEIVEGMLDQMLGLEIKGEISNQLPGAIANAPVKPHTHDEYYYTKNQVNSLLDKKASIEYVEEALKNYDKSKPIKENLTPLIDVVIEHAYYVNDAYKSMFMVSVSIISFPSISAGIHTKILKVPQNFAPSKIEYFAGSGGAAGFIQFKVEQDGSIFVWCATELASIRGSLAWYY